ncbi:MAG TPA: hypothetical protein VN742_08915, partial [Candidatus Binataceae bacterium]|nr:hypothetical protein [Candidatus Binataceae bacterium]
LPHGVAERYLEDLRQFDYPDCYSLLSEADRAARTLPEFLTEIPLAPDVSPVWFRPVLHQTQYVLGEATRDDTTAFVPVRITAPDLPRWERALNQAAGAQGVTAEAVQRSLDRGDYPRRVYDDRIFLVKEHHHWRIVAGFTARDPIVDRHRQALNDYLADRYDKAIPQWRAMIAELKGQQATGSWGLAELYGQELDRLEELRAPAEQAYATRLTLSDVAMKMSEERMPAIFGTVRNTGDRPVDTLAVAVTWYSGRGKDLQAVYREEHPVVATPVEFTDFSRPVLPFAPGESRPFGFVLTAPADVQQQASPYVTISSVALAATPATASTSAIKTTASPTPSSPQPTAGSSPAPH